MKIILLLATIAFACSACSLFQKEKRDELEMITDDVLKHKRGIRIDVEPGDAEK